MKTRMSRLLALLLTLAMLLPSMLTAMPASAEEAVVELPTETVTVPPEAPSVPRTETWDFSDPFQLEDFQLYQSGSNSFTISDGMLTPDGRDGELKAILADTPQNIESVSVDILPGESGVIYGGLYFGASDPGDGIDQINSQVILIKSDYDPAGWTDAINRIDIVRGQFNNSWKHISTTISETGNGNALFSGSKQPLNLRLVFSGDIVLLQLSLVNNPAKYVQLMYEVDPSIYEGQIGLRTIGSDTRFDNLSVTYGYEGTDVWDFSSKGQFNDFESSVLHVSDGYMNSGVSAVESIPWQAVLKDEFTGVDSVSVDMLSTQDGFFYGGISLGGLDGALMIGAGNRDATNKAKAELWVHKASDNQTPYTFETSASDESFFDSASYSPVQLSVKAADGKLLATLTRKDNSAKAITLEYAYDQSQFNGKIGLMADRSAIGFDNLKVGYAYKLTEVVTDRYNFEGYSDANPMTEDFAANAQYSLMDVPDQTGSTDKHLYAVYGLTTGQAPGPVTLQKNYKNVQSISVNMYPDIDRQSWKEYYGGFRVGFKDGTSLDFMGGCSIYEKAYRQYGELKVHPSESYGTYYGAVSAEAEKVAGFFSNDEKNPVNLRLDFNKFTKTITFTMTRLDNNAKMVLNYAYEPDNLAGVFGLLAYRRPLSFDDLEVSYKPIVQKPPETATVVYDFEGYSDTDPMTNDFTANSKYSLLDVTDETGATDKHLYAVYGATSGQTPGSVMLTHKYDRVKRISVNMYPDVNGVSWNEYYGGFRVGLKDGTYLDFMGGCSIWTKAYRKYGELKVHAQGDYTVALAEDPMTAAYFSTDMKDPVNLELVFNESEKTITFTMTRLDNQAKKTLTYAYEPDNLSGEFGLETYRRPLSYDDFTITYVPEKTNTAVYNFEGYSDANPMTNDFTANSKYSLLDVTDETGATDKHLYAVYGATSGQTPGSVMLTHKYDRVRRISVNMYPDVNGISWTEYYGGFRVGLKDGTYLDFMGGCSIYTKAYRKYGELKVHSQSNYSVALAEDPMTAAYFSTDMKDPINLELVFNESEKTITFTMTRLDNQAKKTLTYAYEPDNLSGEFGLETYRRPLSYDDFTITYALEEDANISYDSYSFSAISQQDAFEYYVPYLSGNYIADGKMTVLEMGQVLLRDRIENMEAVSVDIYPDSAVANPFAGIYLGDETTGMVFLAGSRPGADPQNAEITVVGKTGFEYDALGTPIASADGFFTDGVIKPVNLKLEIGAGNITATMSLIENPSVCITGVYTYQADTFSGNIGLTCSNGAEEFDNLTVKVTVDAQEKPDFIYVNQGTSLYNHGYWKASDRLSAVPYTVEAWVKVPKGIYDGVSGTILNGNVYNGAPNVALQMVPYGGLQLVWAVENEDLTTKTAYYNAAVDIRTGQWTHVAYTCDAAADKVVCYVNGEAVQTWENAGLAGMTTADHILADNEYAIGNNMFGWVADVRMWDRALSADELKDSMMTQYTTAKDGLMLNVPLEELVSDTYMDLSGNGNNLTKYYAHTREMATETHEPGAYSIVVIPDQQILSNYAPEKLNQMYQWIADNREKENIQMVLNVGDMADNCGNITQWERNKAAWELLPDDLPFIAVPGNHDYDTNSGWDKGYGVREQLTIMNQYFPLSLFEGYPTESGFFSRDNGLEDNCVNQWQAFEVNGNRYLVLALEYVPQADVVAWANDVVESHPYHQVIMITHAYLSSIGNLSHPYLWNDFVKQHENIIMTFSGHVTRESIIRRMDKGVNGNVVHQMLLDVQHYGSLAMLGILRFNADGTQCNVSYYSTESDMYETGSNATLTLPEHANVTAQVGDDLYLTVTEAIANANGEIVKILKDTDEAITVNADVTIDLAGCTLSNVTVAEGAKLNLIDSTADYAGTKGSATVTGTVERFTENGDDKYMVIGENGVYAPHKYYVGITHVSLDTSVTGFGYKAQFYGDEAVQAQIASIGYDLWLTEDRVVSRSMNKFQNVVTLRLKNFDVVNYGEAPVNAKAIITLVDGTKLESSVNSYSMRSMIELLNDSYADFSVAQLQNVAMFIKQNPVMEGWNVANILAVLQPAANVESITVTDQSMTLLDGTTATLTLNGAYQFTAQDTEQTVAYSDYADWEADYYITMDKEAAEGLYLAGNYGSYGWIAIPVEAGVTYTAVPVVETLLGTSLTYEEMVTDVGTFSCGVADTQGANAGSVVTVELRLTNPENPEESIVLNTTTLTLA